MAFPLIPIAIAAIAVLVLGKKGKKKNGNGGAPAHIVIDFAADDAIPEQIDLAVGDSVEFRLAVVAPGTWTLFTEAVQGEPVVVTEEVIMEPDEPIPGEYGTYVATIEAHERGQVKVDLTLMGVDDVQANYGTVLNIV